MFVLKSNSTSLYYIHMVMVHESFFHEDILRKFIRERTFLVENHKQKNRAYRYVISLTIYIYKDGRWFRGQSSRGSVLFCEFSCYCKPWNYCCIPVFFPSLPSSAFFCMKLITWIVIVIFSPSLSYCSSTKPTQSQKHIAPQFIKSSSFSSSSTCFKVKSIHTSIIKRNTILNFTTLYIS